MSFHHTSTSVVHALADDLGTHRPHQRICNGSALDPRLLRIVDFIDIHLGECDLDERMIRDAFALSRPTLYRLFQPQGGVARYIRTRRLWLAHRHLDRDPGCSVTWLLYEVGFASERQFQRAFLAHFGMSPATWRQCCRRRAQALQPERAHRPLRKKVAPAHILHAGAGPLPGDA
ncbi:helix-turn-helix domain-containing protein [Stenotrophomonas sp. NPDC077659]|uniref:helix-turn-helix domain-containing protein n=1 Tax=Stenotrophomonas sp. NPDC077659 TaxID=3390694 RepID=UPI003D02A09E